MAYELDVITEPADFSMAVADIATGARNELVLGQWEGGVLGFAGVVFPDVSSDDIYAQHHNREPEGREPHFDVYRSFVDEAHPWLGHYNLSGRAALRTMILPDDLAACYDRRYPTQSDEATRARRHFSRIALDEPDAKVGASVIEPMSRFVLPLRPEGPHIVHDIVPEDPQDPGAFVKLIAPPRSLQARDTLREAGYRPLDVFLTQSLGTRRQARHTPVSPVPPRPTPGRCTGFD